MSDSEFEAETLVVDDLLVELDCVRDQVREVERSLDELDDEERVRERVTDEDALTDNENVLRREDDRVLCRGIEQRSVVVFTETTKNC